MTARHTASAPTTLTERQREVLALVAQGKTNFEIAQELGITLEGAKYHVREVMGKLNVESREEAAAWYRHQRRPTTRFATFIRGLIPAAGIWKAAAGVTAGVAVAGVGAFAVYAFTQSGSDDPPPAVAEPTIPGEPPLCGPDDAVFDIFEADPMDDITLLVVTGRAAAPCTLRGTIELTLTEGDPTTSPPAIATSTTDVDIVLDTVRTNIIHANWTGYCGGGLIHATAGASQQGGAAVGNIPGTDLVNEPGCNQPSALTGVFAPPLSFRPDLGPVEEIVCPVTPGWEKQCEVVDAVQTAINSSQPETVLQRGIIRTFVCDGPDSTRWLPLCQDADADEDRLGMPLATPANPEGAIDIPQARDLLARNLDVPAVGHIATIACVDVPCDTFVLGLAVRGGDEPALYMVFTVVAGPPALTELGTARQQSALTLRRGGTTELPGWGELTFTRIIPPY